MGCFGGGKAPSYPTVQAPTLPTATQLFGQGNDFFSKNQPMAYGAREGALQDLQNPTAYYSSFQPTSFEQALGHQNFQNVWPDTQAYMQNILSKSGMAYSPVAAQTLGKEYGNLSTQIGQYLSDQANQRATGSLNARLGIDPMSMLSPFAQTGSTQSINQGNMDWSATKQNADAQYANEMQSYMANMQKQAMMGKLIGGGAGFAFGGPMGASIGSSLGGGLSGGAPVNIGQMMQGAQGLNSSPFGGMFNGFGGGSSGGSGVSLVNNMTGSGSTPSFMNGGKDFGGG